MRAAHSWFAMGVEPVAVICRELWPATPKWIEPASFVAMGDDTRASVRIETSAVVVIQVSDRQHEHHDEPHGIGLLRLQLRTT